ncbi:Vacuolar protein sorting-associated protein vps5 [Blastocladiella emersonii ATCC 22665]|nr:Vacuolar protein sorting-associated protein vps5 [Blastocladiella emersonii ATCC 22665]
MDSTDRRTGSASAGSGSDLSGFASSGFHDADDVLGNPFGGANPFADLPSSSPSPATAAPGAIPGMPATLGGTPSPVPAVPELESGFAEVVAISEPAPPAPAPVAEPAAAPTPAPSLPAPIKTSTPPMTADASRTSSQTSLATGTFTPRSRPGVATPVLRRSMSALAVHDPLLNPLAAATSAPSPTAAPLASATTSVSRTEAGRGSALPTPGAASPSASTRGLPGTPVPPTPASVAPPTTGTGTVSPPPQQVGTLRKSRGPMSFSQAQLQVPSLAASPFTIAVSDPTKVGEGLSPFVVYKVSTKTTMPGFRADSAVSRRYSEFLRLAHHLAGTYPGFVVPGLPEKQAIGRFQEDFVEARRVGLQLFLRKIAAHPVFSGDDVFKVFLEADAFKEELVPDRPPAPPAKSKMAEVDPWFEERRRQLDQFEAQVKSMFKSLESLSSCVRDVATAHFAMGDTIQMMAEIEAPVPMGQRLEKLGELHKRARDIMYAMAALDIGHLEAALDDQMRTIGAMRAAMQVRANAHAQWMALDAALRKKMGTLSKSRFEQPAIKSEVEDLKSQVAAAQVSFDRISQTLRSELERLDIDRVHELSISIQAMVDAMYGHQQSMANLWDDFLESMPAVSAA